MSSEGRQRHGLLVGVVVVVVLLVVLLLLGVLLEVVLGDKVVREGRSVWQRRPA